MLRAVLPRVGPQLSLFNRGTCLPLHIGLTRLYSIANDNSNNLSLPQLDIKWRNIWKSNPPRRQADTKSYDKGKYFALSMFPYPSGILHIGHLRVYTISDVLARYRRMNGYDVIHPMGWDAFGLPAENAAIERKIDPAVWTYSNIDKMKDQMDIMLADFDWEREVITSSPEYYKMTQKLFLMLYESGFAYRKKAIVNWDPVEQTVLANEQVDNEGRSWRSGAIVEKKSLEQWFLAITKLAPELLEDLKILEDWPKKVKTMQRNWIGKSEGAKVQFLLNENNFNIGLDRLTSFTTRPDTLYGVEYVALSLDHVIAKLLSKTLPDLASFIQAARDLPEDSKAGFRIPGLFVSNPLTPEVFDIPVFVAPYVIGDYGHGAVMGCPAHDIRDDSFWRENSPGSVAKVVINPPEGENISAGEIYAGKDGTLNENCGEFSGLSSKEGGEAIIDKVSQLNGLVSKTIQFKIRDWLISRQRFWGAPIPMIHCETGCGIVPVPDKDLPVILPEGLGAPLSTSKEFMETTCPKCNGPAHRDTDTMDTFMDSSWYFFRFTDPKNPDQLFDYKKASSLMPVDIYIGGVEHAILHLLYSRFISKFLAKVGAWSGGDLNGEPIRRLATQGMVHGRTLVDGETGRFLKPDEIDESNPQLGPIIKETGKVAQICYEKMSKSKFNGADPVQCIEAHGADATRAHILFQAPVSDVLNWDEQKIVGIERWLGRVQGAVDLVISRNIESAVIDFDGFSDADVDLWNEVQKKIEQVTIAFHDNLTMNTVVSDYMKLTRTILSGLENHTVSSAVLFEATKILLQLIAPVTPVNAEEGWEKLLKSQGKEWHTIFAQEWPQSSPIKRQLKASEDYKVIINGKTLLSVNIPDPSFADDEVINLIRSKGGEGLLAGKTIKRIIRPKGKLAISIIAS